MGDEREFLLNRNHTSSHTLSSQEEDELANSDNSSKKSSKLTRRQWLTVIVFGVANLASAVCISLQSPFYPEEAENKGATATEYGFVFGIYELTCFLTSPLLGKYLPTLGPRFVYNSGIFLTAGSCMLFGTLDMIRGHESFLGLSFAVRVVEALGSSCTLTATFAIIAAEFPSSVATTFASLETFFGLGLIAGPTIGGFLFQLGGFMLPFITTGGVLLCAGIVSLILLPEACDDEREMTASAMAARNSGLLGILRVPSVLMAAISIVSSSISLGFLSATLEPHLRQFDLTPVLVGLVFIVNGGTYAFVAPFSGYICDHGVRPKVVSTVGNLLIALSYLLMGPAPFIPIDTFLWIVIVGLLLHGGGVGFLLVSCFIDGLRSSIKAGFPDELSTYAIVSGLWASSFALGAFIGPSIGGVLLDSVGFRYGSLVIVALHVLSFIAHICFIQFENCRTRRTAGPRYTFIPPSDVMEPLLHGHNGSVKNGGNTFGTYMT